MGNFIVQQGDSLETISQGDSVKLGIQVAQDGGQANLTGFGVVFALDAGTTALTKTDQGGVDMASAASGLVVVQLDGADTTGLTPGLHYWEVKVRDGSQKLARVAKGWLMVEEALVKA